MDRRRRRRPPQQQQQRWDDCKQDGLVDDEGGEMRSDGDFGPRVL